MKDTIKDYIVEIIIVIIAIILMIFNLKKVSSGIFYAIRMYLRFFPVIISIAFINGIISVFVPKDVISRLLGTESGIKGILIGSIFGTVMVGPAYVFYPFFKEIISKGASYGVIATTIFAWGIKLQWIPFGGAILGWKFIVLLNTLIFIFAILAGIIFNRIFYKK